MKLSIPFHLVPGYECVELYLHFIMRLHAVVFNWAHFSAFIVTLDFHFQQSVQSILQIFLERQTSLFCIPVGKFLLGLISRTETLIRESQFPFNNGFYLVSDGKTFLSLSCNFALLFYLHYQYRKYGLDRYLLIHLLWPDGPQAHSPSSCFTSSHSWTPSQH